VRKLEGCCYETGILRHQRDGNDQAYDQNQQLERVGGDPYNSPTECCGGFRCRQDIRIGGTDSGSQLTQEGLDTTRGTPVVSGIAVSWRQRAVMRPLPCLNNRLYVVPVVTAALQSSVETFYPRNPELRTTGDACRLSIKRQLSVGCQQQVYVARNHRWLGQLINSTVRRGVCSSNSPRCHQGRGCVHSNNVLDAITGDTVGHTPVQIRSDECWPVHTRARNRKTSGRLIYVAATGSGSPSSNPLDRFAPDEVTWSSTGRTPMTRASTRGGSHLRVAR